MSILQGLVDLATQIIGSVGLPGVFVLMMLESMVFPVPSEAVMPFAGFMVVKDPARFHNLWVVTAVATLGSIAGSSLSYFLGAKWGEAFVHRFGRWFLVTNHDWELTQRFFRKTGAWSILIARFVPVVRHLISVPAGATRMRWGPFLAATMVGAFAWNYFLAYVGFKLGENYTEIRRRMEPFDLAIAALLVLGVVAFVWLHVRRLRKERHASEVRLRGEAPPSNGP